MCFASHFAFILVDFFGFVSTKSIQAETPAYAYKCGSHIACSRVLVEAAPLWLYSSIADQFHVGVRNSVVARNSDVPVLWAAWRKVRAKK